jgi:hypothetical protein
MSRVAVVVPLKEGARPLAELLIEDGPPFDLEQTALERHEVFLTDREAVFVFEGRDARSAVELLLGEADVWRAATVWRDCLSGQPQLATEVFSWDRPGPPPLHVPGL